MKYSFSLIIFLSLSMMIGAFVSCDFNENPVQTFDEVIHKIWDFDPIPGAENITAKVTQNRETNYFDFQISGSENDVFLRSGKYSAWCALFDTPINSDRGEYNGVKMYSTLGEKSWNKLNFLLNNKYAYINDTFGATWMEVQVAIWAIIDFPRFDVDNIDIGLLPSALRDGENILFDLSITKAIVSDVDRRGSEYQYQIGDIYAIFAETESGVQNGILEGCTPGFWKHTHKFNFWPDSYRPDDKFHDIFNRNITINDGGQQTITDPTLIQALWATGGGVNALARHAVAALLNAARADADDNIDFTYSISQIIEITQKALDGERDIEQTKNLFDGANNFGCSL